MLNRQRPANAVASGSNHGLRNCERVHCYPEGKKINDYGPPSYEKEGGGLREDTTRYRKRVR